MYSARRELLCRTAYFIKRTEQAYSAEMVMKAGSESTLRNSTRLSRSTLSRSTLSSQPKGSRPKGSSQAAVFRSRLQRDSLVLK